MNRRTFLASSAAAALGASFLRHSFADAATASLSVRPTSGGPLVTPNGQFFLYSQMRYPATLPQAVQVDGLVTTPTRFSLDDLAHADCSDAALGEQAARRAFQLVAGGAAARCGGRACRGHRASIGEAAPQGKPPDLD